MGRPRPRRPLERRSACVCTGRAALPGASSSAVSRPTASGGGGWSGGGAGRYYWSGGGSTYFVQNSGFGTAYTFSTPYSNSNDAHWNFKYANCPHFGISSDTSIKTGLLRGNGWLQVERTA